MPNKFLIQQYRFRNFHGLNIFNGFWLVKFFILFLLPIIFFYSLLIIKEEVRTKKFTTKIIKKIQPESSFDLEKKTVEKYRVEFEKMGCSLGCKFLRPTKQETFRLAEKNWWRIWHSCSFLLWRSLLALRIAMRASKNLGASPHQAFPNACI